MPESGAAGDAFWRAQSSRRRRALRSQHHQRTLQRRSSPPRSPTSRMQILIKTLTGRQQAFNFEGPSKVLEVKNAVQEKEGIQVDQIRLIYGGKQMSDEKTLDDYQVVPGAVIHMVLQLRGGGSPP
jgi:hypothetical protein